jgi:hypothetical protein
MLLTAGADSYITVEVLSDENPWSLEKVLKMINIPIQYQRFQGHTSHKLSDDVGNLEMGKLANCGAVERIEGTERPSQTRWNRGKTRQHGASGRCCLIQ